MPGLCVPTKSILPFPLLSLQDPYRMLVLQDHDANPSYYKTWTRRTLQVSTEEDSVSAQSLMLHSCFLLIFFASFQHAVLFPLVTLFFAHKWHCVRSCHSLSASTSNHFCPSTISKFDYHVGCILHCDRCACVLYWVRIWRAWISGSFLLATAGHDGVGAGNSHLQGRP